MQRGAVRSQKIVKMKYFPFSKKLPDDKSLYMELPKQFRKVCDASVILVMFLVFYFDETSVSTSCCTQYTDMYNIHLPCNAKKSTRHVYIYIAVSSLYQIAMLIALKVDKVMTCALYINI